MPVARESLLKDLQGQVKILEDDLRERAGEPDFHAKLYTEWERARKAERVAVTYETWLDGQVTQSAVAWILATVFVRFCEDNRLLAEPWLAGLGERLEDAADRQQEYYRKYPSHTAREWMTAAFHHMAEANSVVAGLFDEAHNPLWRITPNEDVARGLVAFWRRRGDHGKVIHDFTDPDLDTRFLGDLYQDLSEYAKDTYALLQTPDFVEEFILDRTLDPAIEEFGIDARYPAPEGLESRTDLPDGLRVIDPTCGSGHFLLGAFERLLKAWEVKAPALDRWEQISRALYGVHGADKNPFAVAIARFRLLLAAMRADMVKELKSIPNWQINVAVADSLLHGRGVYPKQELIGLAGLELSPEEEVHTFYSEDVKDYIKSVDILGFGSYHVVVGNPPYIRVNDKTESAQYKAIYRTCYQNYSLTVPFLERFFRLAVRGQIRGSTGGCIGQITGNAFMKSGYGMRLIEEFFRDQVQVSGIIDTSGVNIPGHGTPTVIVFGNNTPPRQDKPIRVVSGIRGVPNGDDDSMKGLVWGAILDQIDHPASESKWVSVADVERVRLATHPWSLSGGGVDKILSHLKTFTVTVKSRVESIGRTTVVGEDDAWILPRWSTVHRFGEDDFVTPIVIGDAVRDFGLGQLAFARDPYSNDEKTEFRPDTHRIATNSLWPNRTILRKRVVFGKTPEDRGFPWYSHLENYTSKLATPLAITFARTATHCHFVFDRGGKIFSQTAPVIKLASDATERDYLELLGILNSSTACFWLKQVCQSRGSTLDSSGGRQATVPWEDFYDFTGGKISGVPLPPMRDIDLIVRLDNLAQEAAASKFLVSLPNSESMAQYLDDAYVADQTIRRQMIGLQEELDWQIYGSYDLIADTDVGGFVASNLDSLPEIDLGQRAFEIVMARKLAAGELETQWFARHGSTPITEIPAHWPEWYQALVARRIDKIESDRNIGLIERPEYKRRWAQEPWEKREKEALRNYILDACEDRSVWYATGSGGSEQAQPHTVYRLADRLRSNPEVVEAARLYSGSNADLSKVLEEILKDEHVPFLAAMRYKPEGLRKRAQWERTWELQREEDATGTKLDIPVPPKYKSSDFLKTSYWRHRGKLDVPKERFISYPGASPDQDGSLLLGWAGWDHKDQAVALVELVHDRKTKSGWETDRLTPLLAGLAELMPWLRQWFSEPDPSLQGFIPAEMFDQALRAELGALGLSTEDLAAWRPAKATRGRKSAR